MTEELKQELVEKSIETYRALVRLTMSSAGPGFAMTHEEKRRKLQELNEVLIDCGNRLEVFDQ